jgi:hypothetical protein
LQGVIFALDPFDHAQGSPDNAPQAGQNSLMRVRTDNAMMMLMPKLSLPSTLSSLFSIWASLFSIAVGLSTLMVCLLGLPSVARSGRSRDWLKLKNPDALWHDDSIMLRQGARVIHDSRKTRIA